MTDTMTEAVTEAVTETTATPTATARHRRLSTRRASARASLFVAIALATGPAAVRAADVPAERRQGEVAYVSGGIADDESTALKAARGRYPLSLELVEKSGGGNVYTADAQVRITRADGSVVLDVKADGPYLLVRLPPGRYAVRATLKGRTVEAKPVDVGGAGSSTHTLLAFPEGTG